MSGYGHGETNFQCICIPMRSDDSVQGAYNLSCRGLLPNCVLWGEVIVGGVDSELPI